MHSKLGSFWVRAFDGLLVDMRYRFQSLVKFVVGSSFRVHSLTSLLMENIIYKYCIHRLVFLSKKFHGFESVIFISKMSLPIYIFGKLFNHLFND